MMAVEGTQGTGMRWRPITSAPNYQGHLPGMKDTFGIRTGLHTRDFMQQERRLRPRVEEGDTPGMRRILVPSSKPLGGGPCMQGIMRPVGIEDESYVYHQGSATNYLSYIDKLENCKYSVLPIKSGNPSRNTSTIALGDAYFFNGSHMFESSYAESHSPQPGGSPTHHDQREQTRRQSAEDVASRGGSHGHFLMLRALVGKGRLEELHREIRWKLKLRREADSIQDLKNGLRKALDFDSRAHSVTPEAIAYLGQWLGVYTGPTEAKALFAMYDLHAGMSLDSFISALAPSKGAEKGARPLGFAPSSPLQGAEKPKAYNSYTLSPMRVKLSPLKSASPAPGGHL